MQEQFPATPQSVIEWNAKVRAARRERMAQYGQDTAGLPRSLAEMVVNIAAEQAGEERLEVPEQTRKDYAAYLAEWNRVANARNAEQQARRNRTEVAKVRAQACPRCFASHPGEC